MKILRPARVLGLLLPAAIGMQMASAGAPLPKGDAIRGKLYFANNCASCHADHLGPGNKPIPGVGPSLVGVVGRHTGAELDFLILDPPTLDKYLTDPDALVPDADMPVSVPRAADRADVIAYLKTLKIPKAAPVAVRSSSAENRTSPKP